MMLLLKRYGNSNGPNRDKLAKLSAEQWESINIKHFGDSKFNNPDLATLNSMFNKGAHAVSTETSQKMQNKAYLLFTKYGASFTFDRTNYPVQNSDGSGRPNTYFADYMEKTAENRNLMFNVFFPNPIGPAGLNLLVAHGLNSSTLGNAFASSTKYDFKFQLTLTRVDI